MEQKKKHCHERPDMIRHNGILSAIVHPHTSSTDPLGSYTGVPIGDDVPVQDADDL